MDQLGFSLRSEEVWSDLTHTDTSAILFLSSTSLVCIVQGSAKEEILAAVKLAPESGRL